MFKAILKIVMVAGFLDGACYFNVDILRICDLIIIHLVDRNEVS